jgi:hypothetical protein
MLVPKAYAINLTDVYAPAKAMGENATVSTLVNPIIADVLIVSGILAFGTILFAGFAYVTSAGDKAKTQQASQALTYGIIGLVVVVAAYLITKLMGSIFGFNFI